MGEHAGPYRLEGELGRGGMGVVYRASDTRSGREVALKLLHGLADAEDRARFLREAQTAQALQHPHLLSVLDYGQHGAHLYLATPLATGGSLADRLRQAPLEPPEAARVVRQVAEGLQAAHAAGAIHRDLKPANVLFDGEGRALLADFGLARRQLDQTLTASGTLLGTPSYMSPEQARGERADARSDVYGLGALLYAALTREPPFPRASVLLTLEAVVTDPTPVPPAPPYLQAIVRRCLAKDPTQRFASAEEVAEALRRPASAGAGRGLALVALLGCLALGAVALAGRGAQEGPGSDAGPPPPSPSLALSAPSPTPPPTPSPSEPGQPSLDLSWTGGELPSSPPAQGQTTPQRLGRLEAFLRSRVAAEGLEPTRAYLRRLRLLREQDPAVHLVAARIFRELGQREASLQALEQATSVAPHQGWVWGARGGEESHLGRYRIALEHLAKASELAPEVPLWHSLRADLLGSLGSKEQAQAGYRRALNLDPDHVPTLLSLAVASPRPFSPELRRAIQVAPDDPEVLQLQAHALYRQQRTQEALRVAERACELGGLPFARYVRGLCLRQLRRPEDALAAFAEALELPPPLRRFLERQQARVQRGEVLHQLGRHEEALREFDQVLSQPGSRELSARVGRAAALRALGRLEDAEAEARRAVALNSSSSLAWLELARALAKLDRHGEAVPCFDRVLQLQPSWLSIVVERALSLAACGRPRDARRVLRNLLQNERTPPRLRARVKRELERLGEAEPSDPR